MLTRRDNESEFDYHRRLVYGKLVDKTLADVDYTEIAPLVYDQNYSSDVARRMLYGSCKTLQKLDSHREREESSMPMMAELEAKKIELQKERERFFDQRKAFNQVIRQRARQEEINEIITNAVKHGDLPHLPSAKPSVAASDSDLLISLNDIHFGACVDNAWCKYNSKICAEMMAHYVERIVSIAKTHSSEGCVVWANGDLISGNIHYQIAVSNNENLIEQVTGVSELIAQFLAALSQHFSYVKYVSVAGNHSRIDLKDRALLNERLDDLVEWYLKARLQNLENVEIGYGDRIDSTMYVVDVRGKTYLGVHGDLDPNPTNIQTLQTMAQRPIYAVLLGHRHHNETGVVQGIRTVMAGSFLGMDDYCIQKRIFGKPEQMVCVCDDSGIVCSYGVELTANE